MDLQLIAQIVLVLGLTFAVVGALTGRSAPAPAPRPQAVRR